MQIILVHLIPYARDIGIPLAIAATTLGLIGGFRKGVIMGIIDERIGWQRGWAISNFEAGVVCLYLLGLKEAMMPYPFVIFYGFFCSSKTVSKAGTLGPFGTRSLAEILSIVTTITMIGGALGFIISPAFSLIKP